jgi:hypothetical protein
MGDMSFAVAFGYVVGVVEELDVAWDVTQMIFDSVYGDAVTLVWRRDLMQIVFPAFDMDKVLDSQAELNPSCAGRLPDLCQDPFFRIVGAPTLGGAL